MGESLSLGLLQCEVEGARKGFQIRVSGLRAQRPAEEWQDLGVSKIQDLGAKDYDIH